MLVSNKAPADLVVDFAAIRVNIELGMFLKLSLATEAVCAHCKVPVARRFITMVVFSEWNVPVLEDFYPMLSMWYTMIFASDGGLPIDREEVLESGVSACSGLLNEQVKW